VVWEPFTPFTCEDTMVRLIKSDVNSEYDDDGGDGDGGR